MSRSSRAPSRERSPFCAVGECRRSGAVAAAISASPSTSSFPRRLTDEQRDELERLRTAIGDDAYRGDDDGFFERLKSAFR